MHAVPCYMLRPYPIDFTVPPIEQDDDNSINGQHQVKNSVQSRGQKKDNIPVPAPTAGPLHRIQGVGIYASMQLSLRHLAAFSSALPSQVVPSITAAFQLGCFAKDSFSV